jgi:hypothetical protein
MKINYFQQAGGKKLHLNKCAKSNKGYKSNKKLLAKMNEYIFKLLAWCLAAAWE